MRPRLFVFCLALSLAVPRAAHADAPLESLMSDFEALGAAREGEADRYTQLERALTEAERSEAAGNEASAARHRELAEALLRGLESTRHAALVRTQLEARREALRVARARLEVARGRGAQAEADRQRTEAGTQ